MYIKFPRSNTFYPYILYWHSNYTGRLTLEREAFDMAAKVHSLSAHMAHLWEVSFDVTFIYRSSVLSASWLATEGWVKGLWVDGNIGIDKGWRKWGAGIGGTKLEGWKRYGKKSGGEQDEGELTPVENEDLMRWLWWEGGRQLFGKHNW